MRRCAGHSILLRIGQIGGGRHRLTAGQERTVASLHSAGYSIQELAELSGTSRATIDRIVQGTSDTETQPLTPTAPFHD